MIKHPKIALDSSMPVTQTSVVLRTTFGTISIPGV